MSYEVVEYSIYNAIVVCCCFAFTEESPWICDRNSGGAASQVLLETNHAGQSIAC